MLWMQLWEGLSYAPFSGVILFYILKVGYSETYLNWMPLGSQMSWIYRCSDIHRSTFVKGSDIVTKLDVRFRRDSCLYRILFRSDSLTLHFFNRKKNVLQVSSPYFVNFIFIIVHSNNILPWMIFFFFWKWWFYF